MRSRPFGNFMQIHHSIEELDWMAAARVHPVDQIMTKGFSLLPVFSLGFSEVAIGISLMIYGWQSVLVHSNLRIKFGPLRWVLASPEFHHWHHSKDLEARDKNFAGQLPLFDILFGTLYMPRGRMPERYGIDEQIPQTTLRNWSIHCECFLRNVILRMRRRAEPTRRRRLSTPQHASSGQRDERHPSMNIPISPAAIAGANAIFMRPSTRWP